MKSVSIIAILLFIVVVIGVQVKMNINFNQNCGGYLERAASANTIETAHEQLSIAINYLEKENLTSGYTSVLWKTPDEDISFWYNNIKNSELELTSLPATTSGLERSNMLIKLRETLMDHGKNGDTVTTPQGISRYPYNSLFGVINWILILFFAFFYLKSKD